MRPEGWEKLEEHPCSGEGCLQCRDYANREAGADAMLEGLWEEGCDLTKEENQMNIAGRAVMDMIVGNKVCKGRWVFIPE